MTPTKPAPPASPAPVNGQRPRAVYGIRLLGKPVSQISVKHRGSWTVLGLGEVVRVSADDDYVLIHARHHRYMVFIRLQDLEARLAPGPFVRVHRGQLINIGHVVRWRRYPGRRLEIDLSDGSSVLSSRRRRTELLELLPGELCELGPHPPVPFTEGL